MLKGRVARRLATIDAVAGCRVAETRPKRADLLSLASSRGCRPLSGSLSSSWGPSSGEGLVRVVRLMLAHGRVVVMMRQGRQEATQCPLRTGSMVRGPG